jgi:hypothetical protein
MIVAIHCLLDLSSAGSFGMRQGAQVPIIDAPTPRKEKFVTGKVQQEPVEAEEEENPHAPWQPLSGKQCWRTAKPKCWDDTGNVQDEVYRCTKFKALPPLNGPTSEEHSSDPETVSVGCDPSEPHGK